MQIQWLSSVDSTNSELMRRAAQGDTRPVLLVADEQTAGRGRLGRTWLSQPGQALTFSMGLPLAPRDWSGLSLVVGMALISALQGWARTQQAQGQDDANSANGANGANRANGVQAAPHTRLGLKWPNDVWLMHESPHKGQAGKPARIEKMAGILIETASSVAASTGAGIGNHAAPQARYAVIGIGLNLLPQNMPSSSVNTNANANTSSNANNANNAEHTQAAEIGITSLAQWLHLPTDGSPGTPKAGDVLHAIADAVLAAVRQFEAEGFAAFQSAFAAWDVLAGLPLVLSDGRQGEGLGVDEQGRLLLALKGSDGRSGRIDGQIEAIASGEVSVRPLAI